jgi:hypothetical protein
VLAFAAFSFLSGLHTQAWISAFVLFCYLGVFL